MFQGQTTHESIKQVPGSARCRGGQVESGERKEFPDESSLAPRKRWGGAGHAGAGAGPGVRVRSQPRGPQARTPGLQAVALPPTARLHRSGPGRETCREG